mmetsp:Transcript_12988/g.24062  ORF Transcript_12988/g.24062 Transcript_12988/m.24062 type:complete len:486 (+) Transcript_12988:235-1692(+)
MGLVLSSLCCACQAVSCTCSAVGCCFSVASSATGGISLQMAHFFSVVMFLVITLASLALRYFGNDLEWDLVSSDSQASIVVGEVKFDLCSGDAEQGDVTYAYCEGDAAVFRMMSGLQCFYLLAMVLSFCGTAFHRGFWFWKIILALGTSIGFLFIPADSFNEQTYITVARIFSVAFILVQMFLILSFGYDWNDTWVNNAETSEGNESRWYGAVLFSSAILYLVSFIAIGAMYSAYSCSLANTVTTITLLSILGFSVLVMLRQRFIEEAEGVILPAAVVSLYVTFLGYSALGNNANQDCKPNSEELIHGIDGGSTILLIVSLCVTTISLFYLANVTARSASSLLTGGTGQPAKETTSSGDPTLVYQIGENRTGEDMRREQEAARGEQTVEGEISGPSEELVTAAFYFALILTSQYVSMITTNWGVIEAGPTNNGQLWVNLTAQWMAIVFFIWTLIAPAVLTNRDFGLGEPEPFRAQTRRSTHVAQV